MCTLCNTGDITCTAVHSLIPVRCVPCVILVILHVQQYISHPSQVCTLFNTGHITRTAVHTMLCNTGHITRAAVHTMLCNTGDITCTAVHTLILVRYVPCVILVILQVQQYIPCCFVVLICNTQEYINNHRLSKMLLTTHQFILMDTAALNKIESDAKYLTHSRIKKHTRLN